jgi:hypothetical protein
MKTIEGGLLSGLTYEPSDNAPEVPDHPAFKLTTEQLLRKAAPTKAQRDALIDELERRWMERFILSFDFDTRH